MCRLLCGLDRVVCLQSATAYQFDRKINLMINGPSRFSLLSLFGRIAVIVFLRTYSETSRRILSRRLSLGKARV